MKYEGTEIYAEKAKATVRLSFWQQAGERAWIETVGRFVVTDHRKDPPDYLIDEDADEGEALYLVHHIGEV